MRRFVSSLRNRGAQIASELENQWNAFWFTPADPTLLGLIRILTGTMLVYTHAVWGLQLEAFFGPNAWLTPELVETMQRDQIAWSFWWRVPAEHLWTVHWTAIGILVLFTLGVATRLTSIASFLIVVSYVNRTPCALFGLDQINGFLTLYCAVGPSGAALSVDNLVRRWRNPATPAAPPRSAAANVALRLIQLQMCVIYFFAGISKLQGPAWWNGEAMWLAFSNYEYQSLDMTWLVRYPWVYHLMTHATIAWELTFWALVWKPMLRPLMLFVGVLLHVGIGLCLGMWTFGLIMLVGCASFLPEPFVRQLMDTLATLARRLRLRVPKVEAEAAPSWSILTQANATTPETR
jgi:hypothetical protein